MRTLLLALALTAPLVHSETLSVEQILEMQKARTEAHEAQERADTSLILALCEPKPDAACIASTRKLIAQYKANLIQLHENDKAFTERLAQSYGIELEDNSWETVPSDKTMLGGFP